MAAANRPGSVLVRRERGIGDVLFALTAVYELKRSHPDLRVDFLTHRDHAGWVRWFHFVDAVHTSPPGGRYGRVIDLEAGLDCAHEGDRCRWMARQAGVAVSGFMPPPELPADLREEARRLLDASGHARLVCLAPYGSQASLIRSLTLEQIRAAACAASPDDRVVLLSREEIQDPVGAGVLNLSGRLTVELAIAVVSLCEGLVGVDSGLVHWAGVFRKPVVALFTHIGAQQRMGPHGNFVAIQPLLPCAPCGDVWPLGPFGYQPACRPTYRWSRGEPRLDCVAVHDGRFAMRKLYEMLGREPQTTVVNFDKGGKATMSKLGAAPIPNPATREASALRPRPREVTSVVILTHNTWCRCTRRCVNSVLQNTAHPFEVILLDNGGGAAEARLVAQEIAALRRTHPSVRLVLMRSEQNVGFPGGVNRALAEVSPTARYVCLLNSDCYVEEPQWNTQAARAFSCDWRLAALSFTRDEHRYFIDGETGEDYYFPELDAKLGDCEVINGACLVVDRNKTGPFRLDETFSPAGREDDDLSFWIRAQGWSVGQSPEYAVIHERGTTIKQANHGLRWAGRTWSYGQLLQRNRKLLLRKWRHMLHPRLGPAASLQAVGRFYRPKVSVILPTHNRLVINDIAIQSVLEQRMTDLELLLVTLTRQEQRVLQQRYVRDRRVHVRRQTRAGIANARNTGLTRARGRYLAHMDDDEWWHPDHLARMCDFLDQREDVMLTYADVHRVQGEYRGGGFVPRHDQGHPWCRAFNLALFRRGNWIPASAAVLRRETVESVGFFDETFRYYDDWEYWLRVATNHPVAHNCTLAQDGVATVEYRLHDRGQATTRDRDVWDAEFARVRRRYGG